MTDFFTHYSEPWLKQHKSILSKRYNKPKRYSGSEQYINGEFIKHSHSRENHRRLRQQRNLLFKYDYRKLLKQLRDEIKDAQIYAGA